MRMIHGYIAPAVVLIPLGMLYIFDNRYSEGCMDALPYAMSAIAGFLIGGILNILYLIRVACHGSGWITSTRFWESCIAWGGLIVSVLTLLLQIAIVSTLVMR